MKKIKTIIQERAKIVKKYCEEKGYDVENLSLDQILEIRALPEWINAGKEEE